MPMFDPSSQISALQTSAISAPQKDCQRERERERKREIAIAQARAKDRLPMFNV